MNTLKRTLALVATLSLSATAFVGCGSSDSSSSKKDTAATTGAATEAATGNAEASTEAGTKAEPSATGNSLELGNVTLKTGGDQFTVVAWNADDAPALIDLWAANGGDKSKANFVNMDCKGGEASEKYDARFLAGDDLDVYFAEADWALKFINDDKKTAPLEALGFSDANFADTYAYTNEIGRATAGANAGKMVGASWQSAPGGFAYRTDLAEQYLGVKTPEEMQEKIGSWDKFVEAASTVAQASNKEVALADSLGGMWQVFSANRTQPWVVDGLLEIDESCKTFADYAKTLWDNGGVTHNGQWSNEWVPAGQSGSAMGYFVSTWGFGGFFAEASSKSQGKWKVVQGPDDYFWGGTWIVVNPETDNAEEAQQFIFNAVVNPDSMKSYALSKPDYVNNVSVMQGIVDANECPNQAITDNLGGQNYFSVLHENAKAIDLKGLITPYDAKIKSAFLDVVTEQYCKGNADWDTVKAEVNKKVLADVPELA